MVPDLTKNQIVVWVPPSTLEIGDLLRSGTFSQLSGTSQVTGGPRSQQVPEFKSSTCVTHVLVVRTRGSLAISSI